MPNPTVAEFWDLLAKSGLVDASQVPVLQQEYLRAGATSGPHGAPHVAHWLFTRGVITRWQAKRLSIGNLGPFFLGDYRLLERHERDGDHLVFSAKHEPSDRVVTVVLLNAKRCQRLDIWTEIVRQTTAANATTNPMLSRTWSLEQHRGTRFIVCESVAGMNVADELEELGPLPAARAGVLVSQVAEAVAEIHAQGAVHGGLSLDAMRREPPPGGVERTGRVRLLQFPLAGDPHRVPLRPWRDDAEMQKLGRQAAYVAPELLHPEAVCDQRADVYSIGAILYALLAGTPPCQEGDVEKTLRKAAFEGPLPLGPPLVSPELATLVAYLMERDPARRYQNAGEAAAAIATCLGFGGGPRPATPSTPERRPATPSSSASPDAPMAANAFAFHDVSGAERPAITSLPTVAAPTSAAALKANDPPSVRSRRQRALALQLVGGGITVAILAGVVALILSRVDFSSRPQPRVAPPRTVARTDPPGEASPRRPPESSTEGVNVPGTNVEPSPSDDGSPPPVAPTVRQMIVVDDSLPWASPTDGSRPRLAYLPPGAQLVLVARPADLVADDEGRLFLQALGPMVEAGLAQLAAYCGCQVSDIESVQAGWQAGEADDVLSGYAVHLVAGRTVAADETARRQAWGPTTALEVEGETIHAGKTLAFWVPSHTEGRVLVVASEAAVATGVPAGPGGTVARESFMEGIVRQSLAAGERPADVLMADLPLELESLVDMLDAERHVTLFGSPHYLLNRGRVVLAGPLAKLVDPLRNLLGESIRGAALSVHFSGNTYLELDAIAVRDPPARVFAPKLAEEVEALAGAVEASIAMLDLSPYGRVLVMRLPAMLRTLVANMRVGVEGNGVVINAYLPRHAGHNIALAAELALSQTQGGLAVMATGTPQTVATTPADALGKLQKKVTIVFAKDTLEMAIQMVSEEVGVPMEIVGTDLQLDGITQNQSFGLDVRDQTADEVLRVILGKANPDGKLVYIVRKNEGIEKILITTRAAVEKRGDPLPPAFQGSVPPEIKKP